MKKALSLLAIILLISLCLGALSGCQKDHVHRWSASMGICLDCEIACDHAWSAENAGKYDHICTTCGKQTNHDYKNFSCIYCGDETIFVRKELPDSYLVETDKKGAVVSFTYDTFAYAIEACADLPRGTIPVSKRAFIYLPYGYDPAKKYNVLYLLHGSGDNEAYWLAQESYATQYNAQTLKMLDNMVEKGECRDCIIVTPCFYTYVPEDSPYAEFNKTVDNVDNTDCMWSKYFGYELRDLISAVESQYLTYADKDTSVESLVASRAHRAYAGLSRGSMVSYESVVRYCLDYIGYVGSFSACFTPAEKVEADIARTHEQFPIYYWYTAAGTKDSLHQNHHDVMEQVAKNLPSIMKEGEDYMNGDNWIWVDKLEFGHSYFSWVGDLRNCLLVFFKANGG